MNIQQIFKRAETPLPIEKVDNNGRILWGKDGLYGQFLWWLYYSSPIHQGVVNSKVTFISAGGLKYTGSEDWDMLNANYGSKFTLEEVITQSALDNEICSGYFFLCKIDFKTKKWRVENLDFELIQPNEDNSIFCYSEDWKSKNQGEKTGYKEYVSFFNRTPETQECVIWIKKKSRQQLDPKTKKLFGGTFSIPAYVSAVDSIMTDIEINYYRHSEVVNGYKGGTLVSLNNGMPESEEAAKKIVSALKSEGSDRDDGGGISVSFSNGKDREPTVLQMNGNDLDKRYESTETGLMKKIMIAHSVINPKLFGVISESSLSDPDLIKDYELFDKTYVRFKQRELADSLNYVLQTLNGMTGEIEFNKFELLNSENLDSKGIIAKALNNMSPLVANKVLDNLTQNEIRGLALLPRIEGGDIIKPTASVFSSQLIIKEFGSCGRSTDELRFLHSKTFESFDTDNEKDFISSFFGQKFAGKLTELQTDILKLVASGQDYGSIIKATGEKPVRISKELIQLEKLGYLDAESKGLKVTEKATNEIVQIEEVTVLYTYEERDDAPKLIGESREFCKELIELNRAYTRKEINQIREVTGVDVWRYRGGWYTQPNGVSRPSCRHEWKQNIVVL